MQNSSVPIGQFWSRDLIKKKKKFMSLFFQSSLLLLPTINSLTTIMPFLSHHVSITTLLLYFPQYYHLPFSSSVFLSILFIYLSFHRSSPYLALTYLSVSTPCVSRARIRTCDLSHHSLIHYQLCQPDNSESLG